jgi:hypothetical protein
LGLQGTSTGDGDDYRREQLEVAGDMALLEQYDAKEYKAKVVETCWDFENVWSDHVKDVDCVASMEIEGACVHSDEREHKFVQRYCVIPCSWPGENWKVYWVSVSSGDAAKLMKGDGA